jgi:hypothetical protein
MIFNMSGGGGAALNFKVMGGTAEPSNPAENTIWIDTDAKITGWLFSSHQPESPAEGMVWIATGSASNAEFNALKKNGVIVSPTSAHQYINGAWVDKPAKTYRNGEWNSWIVYLFKANDQCVDLTGGWVAGSDIGLAPYAGNGGSQSIGETMNLHWAQISGTPQHGAAYYVTKKKIDLTNVNTLKVNCSVAGYTDYCRAGVSPNSQKPWGPDRPDWANCVAWENLTDGTNEIDVSSLTGSYYVMVGGCTYDQTYDPGWFTGTSIIIE